MCWQFGATWTTSNGEAAAAAAQTKNVRAYIPNAYGHHWAEHHRINKTIRRIQRDVREVFQFFWNEYCWCIWVLIVWQLFDAGCDIGCTLYIQCVRSLVNRRSHWISLLNGNHFIVKYFIRSDCIVHCVWAVESRTWNVAAFSTNFRFLSMDWGQMRLNRNKGSILGMTEFFNFRLMFLILGRKVKWIIGRGELGTTDCLL